MRPFRDGERVLFLDTKNRRLLVRLDAGATFHFHGGKVPHDDVIGSDEGSWFETNTGARVVAFRPRLADFVVKMGRGAQVVYPKDIAAMVMEADIGPGCSVLEAGTGSAAVTMALARAVGPEGRVVSYELREPFHDVARENLAAFFGEVPPWVDLRVGDVREVPSGERFDRLILDLAEPWTVLPEASAVLSPGGILCSYSPTTGQVQELALVLRRHGFIEPRTMELLMRTWHVEARSVRPDHRMVAHTGFLTVARKAGGREPKGPEETGPM